MTELPPSVVTEAPATPARHLVAIGMLTALFLERGLGILLPGNLDSSLTSEESQTLRITIVCS